MFISEVQAAHEAGYPPHEVLEPCDPADRVIELSDQYYRIVHAPARVTVWASDALGFIEGHWPIVYAETLDGALMKLAAL